MDDQNQNSEIGTVIKADFSVNSKPEGLVKRPVAPANQTNPIKKHFFGLFHSQLGKNNKDYKSFTGFKPEDLI